MTENEIRPIAEKYVAEFCHNSNFEYTDSDLVCAGIGTALIVARKKDKRIEELKNKNTVDYYEGYERGKGKCGEKIKELEAKIESAKEIIKELLYETQDLTGTFNVNNELFAKAEQFLKGEDE